MKIAVDIEAISKDGSAGGITGLALELIKGFAEKADVLALCTHANIDFLRKVLPPNVEFECIDSMRKRNGTNIIGRIIERIGQSIRAKHIIKVWKADILYCPFGVVNFHVRGIETISTIHDIQHEFYPEFFSKKEFWARRLLYSSIARRAKSVICISEYTKETFCDKYRYPKEKAEVVYNAIQNRFNECDDSILERLELSKRNYILYPANFWQHKNHKRLICAFSQFAKKRSKIKLVLTGNMFSQYEKLQGYIEKYNMKDRVVAAGYIDEDQLYALMKHCKGLIFPSLFEGFGIPVIEAMQMYKPIACSNAASLPEIGCDSLFYFDPKNIGGIIRGLRFIADTEVTDDMINDYNINLRKYDRENMINSYMNIFTKVLGN